MSLNREKVLHLDGIGVCYRRGVHRKNGFWPLKDVSFDVFKGETLGIIGKNGAGKSTLLRFLADIILSDKGRIERNCDRISLLSLQAGFNMNLSGRENALMSGMLQGISRRKLLSCMDVIVDFSELDEFIDMPVKTYSAGMRARLGFAVALQVKPDVLLVDEILGVGDEQFKRKSSEALQGLIRSDRTVILVSHQAGTIKQLCDRAILLHAGKTLIQGKPEDVLAEYNKLLTRKS